VRNRPSVPPLCGSINTLSCKPHLQTYTQMITLSLRTTVLPLWVLPPQMWILCSCVDCRKQKRQRQWAEWNIRNLRPSQCQKIKITVSWDVTAYSSEETYLSVGSICRPHFALLSKSWRQQGPVEY